MLGWLPFIGPIIDGIVSIFKGKQNVEIQKYIVDGKVDVEAMKASVAIVEATKDDIGIRLARDLLVFPPVIWAGLIGWDTIVALNHPQWMISIAPYPAPLVFLPYCVAVFLLGNIGLNMWRMKR